MHFSFAFKNLHGTLCKITKDVSRKAMIQSNSSIYLENNYTNVVIAEKNYTSVDVYKTAYFWSEVITYQSLNNFK